MLRRRPHQKRTERTLSASQGRTSERNLNRQCMSFVWDLLSPTRSSRYRRWGRVGPTTSSSSFPQVEVAVTDFRFKNERTASAARSEAPHHTLRSSDGLKRCWAPKTALGRAHPPLDGGGTGEGEVSTPLFASASGLAPLLSAKRGGRGEPKKR